MNNPKTITLHIEEIPDTAITNLLTQAGWTFTTFRKLGMWTRDQEDQDEESWFYPNPEQPGAYFWGGDNAPEALTRFLMQIDLANRIKVLQSLQEASKGL